MPGPAAGPVLVHLQSVRVHLATAPGPLAAAYELQPGPGHPPIPAGSQPEVRLCPQPHRAPQELCQCRTRCHVHLHTLSLECMQGCSQPSNVPFKNPPHCPIPVYTAVTHTSSATSPPSSDNSSPSLGAGTVCDSEPGHCLCCHITARHDSQHAGDSSAPDTLHWPSPVLST